MLTQKFSYSINIANNFGNFWDEVFLKINIVAYPCTSILTDIVDWKMKIVTFLFSKWTYCCCGKSNEHFSEFHIYMSNSQCIGKNIGTTLWHLLFAFTFSHTWFSTSLLVNCNNMLVSAMFLSEVFYSLRYWMSLKIQILGL